MDVSLAMLVQHSQLAERLIEVLFNRETNMTLSEKEKMLAGELYRSTGSELQAAMADAQQYLRRLNAIPNEDFEWRFGVLHTSSLVEQAVESHVSNSAKRGAPVGTAILSLRVHYRERGDFAQKNHGVHQRRCTKVLPLRQ